MPKGTYVSSKEKEFIREYVFLFFKDCNYILTLPNLYFDLEKQLLKERKSVDCCEHKFQIFKKQEKIAPSECKLHFCDVGDMNLSKYDGIFLDLCGYFTLSAGRVLNKIKPGTKIAITVLMSRENRYLQSIIDIKNREDSYLRLLSKYNIFVINNIKYHSKGRTQTKMCVFFGIKR